MSSDAQLARRLRRVAADVRALGHPRSHELGAELDSLARRLDPSPDPKVARKVADDFQRAFGTPQYLWRVMDEGRVRVNERALALLAGHLGIRSGISLDFVPAEYMPDAGLTFGWHSFRNGVHKIRVRSGLPIIETNRTILHELFHCASREILGAGALGHDDEEAEAYRTEDELRHLVLVEETRERST